jgi:hypothetical protein
LKLKEKIKFIRFGGLSPVIQEGYSTKMKDFHSPPARRGFYSFVYPYIEPFLLGGVNDLMGMDGTNNKVKYVLNSSGKRIYYDELEKENPELLHKYSMGNKKWFSRTIEYRKHCEKAREWEKENKIGPYPEFVGHTYVLVEWAVTGKIFTVSDDCLIWNHLIGHVKFPIQSRGQWILTTVYDFRLALEKEKHNCGSSTWMSDSKIQNFKFNIGISHTKKY